MRDAVTVGAVLHAAALELLDGLRHVVGDGAELRVGHETAGAEDLAETADLAHLIGRGHSGVEVELAGLNLLHELVGAHDVGTGLLGGLGSGALGEDGHADGLAGAVGQAHGAAQLLVGLTGIDAQAEVAGHRLVEVGHGDLLQQLHSGQGAHRLGRNLLLGLNVLLSVLSHCISFRGNGGRFSPFHC